MCAYQVPSWATAPWFLVTPPQPQGTVFERPRLVEALDHAVDSHQLTLITAPAGSGKTTALSQWARHHSDIVSWLSLTRFDDDPKRLMNGIMSAFHRLASDSADPSFHPFLEIGPPPVDINMAQEAILDAISVVEKQFVLIIDDAHFAGDHIEDAVVSMFRGRASDNIRVIISGRPSIARDVVRSVLHGPVGSIGADLLTFTEEEIEQAGTFMDRPIDRDRAGRVYRNTKGWPVAVRMSLLAASATVEANQDNLESLLSAYVLDEILNGLTPELIDFTLAATTCSRLNQQLATALSGNPDSALLLEECARKGLFLDRFSRRDGETIYQWHAVFAEQCRTILRQRDPERSDRLNRVAASGLAESYPMQAVVHAIRGNDPEMAVRIIEDNWLSLLITSNVRLLAKACTSLPEPWVDNPQIMLIRACCIDLDDDRLGSSMLYDRATSMIEQGPAEDRGHLDLIHALATLIVVDDRDQAIAATETVESALRGNHRLKPSMVSCALFLLGSTMARLRYQIPRAVQFLRTAIEDLKATGQHAVAQRANANLGFALAFGGSFQTAREHLATVDDPTQLKGAWLNLDGGITAVALAILAYWQDELDESREACLRAIRLGGSEASYSAFARVFLAFVAAANRDPNLLTQAQVGMTRILRDDARGAPWGSYRNIEFGAPSPESGAWPLWRIGFCGHTESVDLGFLTAGLEIPLVVFNRENRPITVPLGSP